MTKFHNVQLVAVFYNEDRTDVIIRTHEVDVTDDLREMLINGTSKSDACEYLKERTGEKLGWMQDASFIEWQSARVLQVNS